MRGGILGILNKVLSPDATEYLKAIARAVRNGESIGSLDYLWMGHRGAIRHVIRKASMLLPNSESEYRRLEAVYGVGQAYRAVPNAIDLARFDLTRPANERFRDGVLCVARIEGRKNQLNLIRALRGTGLPLFIVGKASPNCIAYEQECRREAGGNVVFVDHMSQEDLVSVYKAARVHVLPSWFETTGLSSLEAAYMGCNLVITDKGDTREYFGDEAFYCQPEDPDSIRKAVEKAYRAPFQEGLRTRIRERFTWERTAEKTLEGYRAALSGDGSERGP
jgi:glycosyltransferase involved in cell wall biosynthesis